METEPKIQFAQESNPEEREETIKNRMLAIQLEYADKLSKGEIPFVDGTKKEMSFEEAVLNYTRVRKELRQAYSDRTGRWDFDNNEEYGAMAEKVKDAIRQELEQSQDLNVLAGKIYELIGLAANEIPPKELIKKDSRHEAGLIHYFVMSGMKELEDYGVDPKGTYIDIHFDALFKQKNEQGKPMSIFQALEAFEKSMHEIAGDVEQKYPKADAVIGASWILDPKIGLSKKMGFRGLKPVRGTGFSQGNGFWGQFIDFNGQIKEDEVKKFLQTGKPKYKLTVGHIPIAEFLEKYGGVA